MLKRERIEVFISYRNYTHYVKLGYEPILNDYLDIKTSDLSTSSHVRVDVICEICGKENNLQYNKYLSNRKRCGFYGCKSCSRQKASITSIEKYGVDNFSKTIEWKLKVEKTNIEKFGFKTNLICPEFQQLIKKQLKEKYGTENWFEIRNTGRKRKKFTFNEIVTSLLGQEIKLSEDSYNMENINTKYTLYRNECRRLSEKNIKFLLEKWNGNDYYTGENISSNFDLDHNDPGYPTIDHKYSIYWGFINKIDPNIIASESNFCITKRSMNSKKRDLNEDEFKKMISGL